MPSTTFSISRRKSAVKLLLAARREFVVPLYPRLHQPDYSGLRRFPGQLPMYFADRRTCFSISSGPIASLLARPWAGSWTSGPGTCCHPGPVRSGGGPQAASQDLGAVGDVTKSSEKRRTQHREVLRPLGWRNFRAGSSAVWLPGWTCRGGDLEDIFHLLMSVTGPIICKAIISEDGPLQGHVTQYFGISFGGVREAKRGSALANQP